MEYQNDYEVKLAQIGALQGSTAGVTNIFEADLEILKKLKEGGGGGQGPTGPTGPTGAQGEVGPTGPAGSGTQRDYLTFTCTQDGGISMSNNNGNLPDVKYKKNTGDWTQWDYSNINCVAGDVVKFKGNNPNGFCVPNAQSWNDNYKTSIFVMTGRFNGSGNIMSLIDELPDGTKELPNSSACFKELFKNCSSLLTPPELPATILHDSGYFTGGGCYRYMFYGCSNLQYMPELPAKLLAGECYYNMFKGCTSLTEVKELPAEHLTGDCYNHMFEGCTGIKHYKPLNSLDLANSCYDCMFKDCTSLKSAHDLPASYIPYYAYNGMFMGCTSLISAPSIAASSVKEHGMSSMFKDCTNLVVAPIELKVVAASGGYDDQGPFSQMFEGCTNLVVPPKKIYVQWELGYWGDYEKNPTGYGALMYRMFYGCTSLKESPIIITPTIQSKDFKETFKGCTNLSKITCLTTTFNNNEPEYGGPTDDFTNGVAANGIFYKHKNATWSTGVNGIPSGWKVVDYEEDVQSGTALSIWTGTQAEYDAITTKNPSTMYVIKAE